MKRHADEGKFAAPRWLVYPELSAWTIGWRMGYGEQYRMNEPPRTEEFSKLFPMPRNWLFDPRKSKFDRFPFLAFLWDDDGLPKYSQISDDSIEVNEFITISSEEEFQIDANMFKSIEHVILFSKYASFGKCGQKVTLEELKEGFELTGDELEEWNIFKYTVCLNAAYYKIMQDEELKQWLLDTADKSLIYVSDDEWGGEENLFGFALMELRDEIRRLYENEDLIDWEYTDYLKHRNPYENPKPRDPNDKQSAEYMIISSTISSSAFHVRDVNLDEGLAGKYEVGQILLERAFVDATDRIGGMITSHRYLIVSNHMADLSGFEHGTNWGLHTANRSSKFRVIDIYEVDGKTQIALLHLPDGFEGVFQGNTDIEREIVEEARKCFNHCLTLDAIPELTTPEWLERISFPLGMDDKGEFFKD